MWFERGRASTPDEGGERLELVDDDAARRLIGLFAEAPSLAPAQELLWSLANLDRRREPC
jgi:hypothetical protein